MANKKRNPSAERTDPRAVDHGLCQKSKRVVMQYVPPYCSMPGHEVFDDLAKEDEQPCQSEIDITCDAVTFIPITYRTKVIRS